MYSIIFLLSLLILTQGNPYGHRFVSRTIRTQDATPVQHSEDIYGPLYLEHQSDLWKIQDIYFRQDNKPPTQHHETMNKPDKWDPPGVHDRSSFNGDKCPGGRVRVNGRCVETE